MQNKGAIRFLRLALTTWILALAGCGGSNNGQANDNGAALPDAAGGLPGATTLPDAAIGTYDVVLSGDWTGTAVVTIQSSSAVLESLYATRGSWVANLPGPYDTKSITNVSGSWHFQWDEQVLTNGTPVRQQIEIVVADAGFTSSGFAGQYTHASDLTGTHSGTASATRQ
jgi:hypothetical protein